MAKMRVGYIIDDIDQPFVVWDLIKKSEKSLFYSIEALIVRQSVRASSRKARGGPGVRGILSGIERSLFSVIENFEKLVITRHSKYGSFFRNYPLETLDIEKIYVRSPVSSAGSRLPYAEDDLEKIRRLNLDLLLTAGEEAPGQELFSACRRGTISVHHANGAAGVGCFHGFWETLNREPCTGFIIQKFSNALDGGRAVFGGKIANSPIHLLNRVKSHLKANAFLHLLLERMASGRGLPKVLSNIPVQHSPHEGPVIGQQLSYISKTLVHLSKKGVGRLLGKSSRWRVAYQFTESWMSAALHESTVIKNPPNRFFSDPFVKVKDGRAVLYVEDYNYGTSKGKITAIELLRDRQIEIGTALEEPFHLSYPFIFEAGEGLYMCPESHQANDIRLYKCLEFPLRWRLHRTLMKDVSAADTNIVEHDGKWWMFTNIDTAGIGDHASELHIFFADTFDSEEWVPHPENPVIFDSLRARNGGLILHDGDVYRVFQIQAFDMYGASVGVAKILELNADTYREEAIFSVPPTFFKNLRGVHSFAFDKGVLAFDFMRYENHTN